MARDVAYFTFLLAASVCCCGGSVMSGARQYDGGDAGNPADAARDVAGGMGDGATSDAAAVGCTSTADCEGKASCQHGQCCSGAVDMAGACMCGSDVGCDISSVSCNLVHASGHPMGCAPQYASEQLCCGNLYRPCLGTTADGG